MKLKNKSVKIMSVFFGVIVLLSLITAGFIFWKPSASEEDIGFAECLTEKDIKMYGSNSCGYCIQQKEMFGESFENVQFVNCGTERKKCSEAGIRGYPTWVIDGKKYPGLKSLEKLSEMSGCELQ